VKFRLQAPAFAAIAIVSGVIVLLGYFIQTPLVFSLRELFLNWAIILTAIALGVGVINLLRVHWRKAQISSANGLYSIVLIASLLITFVVAVVFGLTSRYSVWIFDHILVPVEASLLAVLAVVLIYAIARLFFRRMTFFNILFATTALFILAVTALLSWVQAPLVGDLRDWINRVWSLAGTRAILIGVALGAIATGLRVLIGADRPYEG
jgi:hypothetical protein